MTLTVDVAIEQERTDRRENAIAIFAKTAVSTEVEIRSLRTKADKLEKLLADRPNFDDALVVDDYLRRNGQY